MRDLLLFAIVLGLLPSVFKRPQVGIYLWSWLSYMNPHRLAWGLAYSFPFAQLVAIVTLMSMLAWKGPKDIPRTGLTGLWAAFIVWMFITTLFAYYPAWAWPKLVLVIKIQLVAFLTVALIRSKRDLDVLIWVIVLSIGFFSIKGGAFTILTLGSFRVWGPAGSFIADNNALAVASFMIVPMMFYLYGETQKQWLKWALLIGVILTVVSAFGSQSRGALIAAIATGMYFWWKSPGKIVTGFLVIVLAAGILSFMPETWWARMYTILEYEQDGSAMGRLAAWELSYNVASARFFGAGFDFWGPEFFQMYSDNPDHWDKSVAAHSIYFTCLGEHGFVGLIFFLLIFLVGWRTASTTARRAREFEELAWLERLMRLLQVSLVSYASGGAFLNLAYFDLPWHIIAIIVIGRRFLEARVAELAPGKQRSQRSLVRAPSGSGQAHPGRQWHNV